MKITNIAKIIHGRQDGAIFGEYLFSFNECGMCHVYKMEDIISANGCEVENFAFFKLGDMDKIVPHCNAVFFGKEYYSDGDEFPLLYANVYNNYQKCEEKLKGVCVAYRLQKNGDEFRADLVQVIEVGFVDDTSLWSTECENGGIRPYGNFVADRKNGILYAFTMRDVTNTTRYFSFRLPGLSDGVYDEKYGVNKVILNKEDILSYFDCEYHRFIQGACFNEGRIYSVEGFTNSTENPPAIRIIDTEEKKQTVYANYFDYGLCEEAELIDFYKGELYYCDNFGKMYRIDF